MFTIFPDLVDRSRKEASGRPGPSRWAHSTHYATCVYHTTDVHRTVDDAPFGGGAGMVLRPGPVFAAVEASSRPDPVPSQAPVAAVPRPGDGCDLAASRRLQLCCAVAMRHRQPRHRPPGRRGLSDRRLRARRRGGGGLRRDRSRHPAAAGRDGQRGVRRRGVVRGRRPARESQWTRPASFRGWDVPEIVQARATTAASPAGATPRPSIRTVRLRPGPDAAVARAHPWRRPRSWNRPRSDLCCFVPRRRPGAVRAMKPTDIVDQASLRTDIPRFPALVTCFPRSYHAGGAAAV